MLYCVIIGDGYLSQCYITHSASDSASIFQQFMGMTAPKLRGTSEISHPHAGHLPYLPEPRTTIVVVTVSHVSLWFRHCSGGGGVVLICHRWGGLEKCYVVLHCVCGRSKNTIFRPV